jgi:hypothetical protein
MRTRSAPRNTDERWRAMRAKNRRHTSNEGVDQNEQHIALLSRVAYGRVISEVTRYGLDAQLHSRQVRDISLCNTAHIGSGAHSTLCPKGRGRSADIT